MSKSNSVQINLSNVDGVKSNLKVAVVDLDNGHFLFRCTVLDQDLYDLKMSRTQFEVMYGVIADALSKIDLLLDGTTLVADVEPYEVYVKVCKIENGTIMVFLHWSFKRCQILTMPFTKEEFMGVGCVWEEMMKRLGNIS